MSARYARLDDDATQQLLYRVRSDAVLQAITAIYELRPAGCSVDLDTRLAREAKPS